jgi:tetratricopeptide (TPR) repeat protein
MKFKSANIILMIAFFCASVLSFSQVDEGLTLLEDSDDDRILFENHFFEALKYKAIGNFSRAITELEKCQQLFPNDDSIEFELSKNHLSLNHLIEATLYIEKAMNSKPTSIWYLTQAKLIYLKQYDYKKAIAVQHKIIEQKPNKKEDLVLVYILSNQREKAQKVLDELIADGITSSKTQNYSRALSNSKKTKSVQKITFSNGRSISELKKIFKSDKQFDVLKEILTQTYKTKNFEELKEYSAIGYELFPAQPLVYLMQGRSFNYQKKYTDAIDVLIEGLDFIVEDNLLEANFYDELALCYVGLNLEKKVKEAKSKAIKLRNN